MPKVDLSEVDDTATLPKVIPTVAMWLSFKKGERNHSDLNKIDSQVFGILYYMYY